MLPHAKLSNSFSLNWMRKCVQTLDWHWTFKSLCDVEPVISESTSKGASAAIPSLVLPITKGSQIVLQSWWDKWRPKSRASLPASKVLDSPLKCPVKNDWPVLHWQIYKTIVRLASKRLWGRRVSIILYTEFLQKCTCCVIVDNLKKKTKTATEKKCPRCTKGWRGVRSVRDKSIMDTNSCAASALLGRKWGGHRVQSRRTHVPLGRIAFLSFFSFQKWLRDDV